MNFTKPCPYPYALLVVIVMISNPCRAQDLQPSGMPNPDQAQLAEDQHKLSDLTAYAQKYAAQVNDYQARMQSRCASIAAQKRRYEQQSQLLEKEIRVNPRLAAENKVQLEQLRAKMHDQDLLLQQAAKNMDIASSWVRYVQAQLNNTKYGVSEDQQRLTDEATKAEIALEEQERKTALQQITNDNAPTQYYPQYTDYYDYGNLGWPFYLNPNDRYRRFHDNHEITGGNRQAIAGGNGAKRLGGGSHSGGGGIRSAGGQSASGAQGGVSGGGAHSGGNGGGRR